MFEINFPKYDRGVFFPKLQNITNHALNFFFNNEQCTNALNHLLAATNASGRFTTHIPSPVPLQPQTR